MDVIKEITSRNRNDYQRDNFDAFLKKVGFSYTVPSIHIAGTNGKGGTATYLKDIYQAHGYKVGLFTSPDDLLEMITINSNPIDIEEVESIYNEYRKLFDKFDLSAFEIETFIALTYFERQKPDLAIIECGMGGEIDATNIFTPILSIITSISIEHSDFLGVSLSEIAHHKAGIIKEEVPVVISSSINDDALKVIVSHCKEKQSKLVILDQYHHMKDEGDKLRFDYRPYTDLVITDRSIYRLTDACLAIEATNLLQEKFPVSGEEVKAGILNSHMKCRFEIFKGEPTVILDGAHNVEAMNRLRIDMDHIRKSKVHVIFASFRDKNIALEIPEIALLGKVYLTTFDNPRSRTEEDYFLYLEDYPYTENPYKLFESLYNNEENKEDIILITGSLAFAYHMRKYILSRRKDG